ncbi:MAG: type IV secretion system protein [Nevskia sp.]|nr:type IV secretion system protein [Nevskia sp.]
MAEYAAAAESFYDEGYRRIKASRDRAWIVAAVAAGLAGLALLTVALLVPLKRVDVVPVVVDRSTGEAHTVSQLAGQTISQQEAVRKADLAAYVIARESFDRALLRQFYGTVQSRSAEAVFKPYAAQFQTGIPDSIYTKYAGASRGIEVRSVVLLGEALGQVHFTATLTKAATAPLIENYIASVGFEYLSGKQDFAERLRNPLGFVVTSYRVDQESLPKEGSP